VSSSPPPDGDWTKAAVILAIFADEPHDVIFIERASHLRKHAGQIGLPGGSADAADGGDPTRTALRELSEELGVGSERVRVVGVLPETPQMSNRFLVTPIVGVVEPATPLTIDRGEIVGVFTVPLESILSSDGIYEDVEVTRMRGRPSYALDYEGRHIWGLTGRILKSFADAWNASESPLRGAVEAAFASTQSKSSS
jgi:8-oxo-dGTP pyrophosphatase MutT (NUDIX family)